MARSWSPKSIVRCLSCNQTWQEVAYRNCGLCVACHKRERRAGRLDHWSIIWQGRRKLANGRRARDPWVGVLDVILERLPASTIEAELKLADGTVRSWYYELGTVPFNHRVDLVELAKRSREWKWTDEEGRSA